MLRLRQPARNTLRASISLPTGQESLLVVVCRCLTAETHAVEHFLTVSQVRVVTSMPKAFSINLMNTGPCSLGR